MIWLSLASLVQAGQYDHNQYAFSGGGRLYDGLAYAPPNVVFMVDLHNDMSSPCIVDVGDPETSCSESVQTVIENIVARFGWARYGVGGMAGSGDYNSLTRTVGERLFYRWDLGAEDSGTVSTDIANLVVGHHTKRSLASSVASYLDWQRTAATFGLADTDLNVIGACQNTHIVIITNGAPIDESAGPLNHPALFPEIPAGTTNYCCNDLGASYATIPVVAGELTASCAPVATADEECLLDNVAYWAANNDLTGTYAGTQQAIIHSVLIDDGTIDARSKVGGTTTIGPLLANVSGVQGGASVASYIKTDGYDHALYDALVQTMWHIRDVEMGWNDEAFEVSLATQGNKVATAWSEMRSFDITGGFQTPFYTGPRMTGHMRIDVLEDDPASVNYGTITSTLVPNVATLYEGRDFTGVYPFEDYAAGKTNNSRVVYTYNSRDELAFNASWVANKRMPFNETYADDLFTYNNNAARYPLWNIVLPSVDPSDDLSYSSFDADFTRDGLINADDLKHVISMYAGDLTREYSLRSDIGGNVRPTYGDYGEDMLAAYFGAKPTLVNYDEPLNFSSEEAYNNYTEHLKTAAYGEYAMIVSADCSIRMFQLQPTTDLSKWTAVASNVAGAEIWTWVPYQWTEPRRGTGPKAVWAEQFIYGHNVCASGDIVVQDVWIDQQANNAQAGWGEKALCTAADMSDCEYRRVMVANQGMGGPYYEILDITNPYEPKFINDAYTLGYHATSRGVIATVFDSEPLPIDQMDRPIVFAGVGRALDRSTQDPTSSWKRAQPEPILHGFPIIEHDRAALWNPTANSTLPDWDGVTAPFPTTYDGDTGMEFIDIEAPLTLVDVDADGDPDTAYIVANPTFDKATGPGDGVVSWFNGQPGEGQLYKACRFKGAGPDPAANWVIEHLGTLSNAYYGYKPTVSWTEAGDLAIWVGSGGPYDMYNKMYGQHLYESQTVGATPGGEIYFGIDPNPGICGTAGGFTFSTIGDPTGTPCFGDGIFELDQFETLASEPVVYAGYVLFTTRDVEQTPDVAACDIPTARLRAINYETCDADSIDTMGFTDGINVLDADAVPSNIAITDMGTLLVTTNADATGSATTIRIDGALYDSVKTFNWMEVF